MRVEQTRRLKELEKDNSQLKRLVADLFLDNAILKEAARGTPEPVEETQRGEPVCREYGVSERRACRALGHGRAEGRNHGRNTDDAAHSIYAPLPWLCGA